MKVYSMNVESLESRRLLSAGLAAGQEGAIGNGAELVVPLSAASTTPKPTEGGRSIIEPANQKFTVKLGEFHFKTVDELLTASINWGDGTHSDGTIGGSYATGEHYVTGTHTYTHPGTFKVEVKIFARPAGSPIQPTSPVAQFTSVITATPLKPSEGGKTLAETTHKKFTTRLGEFTYRTIDQALNAVIDWGDGTFSAGTLDGSYATGKYYVVGTHTYAHAGTYKIDVKIFASLIGSPIHPTSPVAEFTSVAKVSDAA